MTPEQQSQLINALADGIFGRWRDQNYFVQVLQTLRPYLGQLNQQQAAPFQHFQPQSQPGAPLVTVRRTLDDGTQVLQQTTTAQLLAELLDKQEDVLAVLEEIRDRKKKI